MNFDFSFLRIHGNKHPKEKTNFINTSNGSIHFRNHITKDPLYSKFLLPVILILTAIVFYNSIRNDFINNWDDQAYVINNPLIKHLSWENLKIIFTTFSIGNYHPLTILSFALEYKLFGLNPFYNHFTNYILHLLNVILVYFFIKRFSGKYWLAAITSLFFALHPMHVESVAWILERKDLLYSFFFLLSLISYCKYKLSENKYSNLLWSLLWFILSLLSKPAAVCLPLVLVLIDYYIDKKFSWKSLVSKIHFFILSLAFGVITIYAQKSLNAISDINPSFNIIYRIFLVSYSSIYYLVKVFLPFNLSVLHYYPVKSGGMFPIEYYLALPAIILIIFGVVKARQFKRELVFGLLFYFITIALVLQLIPVGQSIVSERYSYIPTIGIFFIFGQFFSFVKDNKFSFSNKIKAFLPVLLVALTIVYSFQTYERIKYWKNGIVLFTDVIKKYPEEGFGWWGRGNSEIEKKDFKPALDDYNKSILLGSRDATLFTNRGIAKENLGDNDGAFLDFNAAIKIDSNYS